MSQGPKIIAVEITSFEFNLDQVGRDFALKLIMQPLERYQDDLIVISNLAMRPDNTTGSGHATSNSTYLSGALAKDTRGADVSAGTTVDQLIAQKIGQDTPLPSMQLAIEDNSNMIGVCDGTSSCTYLDTMAWSDPDTPLPNQINPRVVFDRLFGNVDSTDPAVRAARLRRQGSILDSVLEKVDRLQGGLGTRDRAKLDEYLQSVREIERRIQNAESQGRELPVVESPAGIPVSYDEHARLMFDMQALAFQTDTTRVITFQIGREQSGATYPQIGVSDSHHPISHHGGDRNKIESLAKINAYHASLFAYFLERLASMPDGDDGTVLDNVVTLYGSAISEGNSHDVRNLPLLLAGGGGGRIASGRHVKYPDETQRLTNLQLTLLNTFGVPVEQFGDSTGERLTELSELSRSTDG